MLKEILILLCGYLFGKLIEIAIRDFKKFGWRIPKNKEVFSKNKNRKIYKDK